MLLKQNIIKWKNYEEKNVKKPYTHLRKDFPKDYILLQLAELKIVGLSFASDS